MTNFEDDIQAGVRHGVNVSGVKEVRPTRLLVLKEKREGLFAISPTVSHSTATSVSTSHMNMEEMTNRHFQQDNVLYQAADGSTSYTEHYGCSSVMGTAPYGPYMQA